MRALVLLAAALLAGCAVTPQAAHGGRPGEPERREFTDAQIRTDVEESVRARFGPAAFDRALRAEASVMAKLYQGLPPPPVRQPDGTWADPQRPTALLLREHGRWLAYVPSGERPLGPEWAAEVEGLLKSAAFWSEARRVPQGGCTDGGSSLLVIRYPGRGDTVRQGTCGGPLLHRRLISAASAASEVR